MFQKVRNNLQKEIEKAQWELEQSKIRLKEIGNQRKWLDWLVEYVEQVKLKTVLTKEKKREYLDGLLERIEVCLDKQTLNHDLKVFFRVGLVDDRVKYSSSNNKSDGYEVIEGKKDKTLVIYRADVLKLQQEARRNGIRESLKKKG